ncbi:MAG: hypothetical protein ACI4F5_07970 [Acutalibacteraceae bacterium]
MLKFFNKKTMIVYIIMIVVFAILGTSLIGVNIHYRKAFVEATSTGNELTDKIVNGISSLLQGLVDKAANKDSSASSSTETKEPEYDDATKAIMQKRDLSFAFMIVSYCLMAVFSGLAIAASEYPKYLEGDKYKAKQRRIERAKKNSKGVV